MRKILLFTSLVVAIVLSGVARADISAPDYYTLGSMEVREVGVSQQPVVHSMNMQFNISPADSVALRGKIPAPQKSSLANGAGGLANVLNPVKEVDSTIKDVDSTIDDIINTGEKVWQIVEAGKPVMNVVSNVASALPRGTSSMNDLDNWQAPQVHTYQVDFKNLMGMRVVSFQYRVVTITGGDLNGVGKYVGYAGIQPENIYVAWGFKFDATASAPTTFNSGSKDAPVGALNLVIDYSITSPLTAIRQSQSYYVTGAGDVHALD